MMNAAAQERNAIGKEGATQHGEGSMSDRPTIVCASSLPGRSVLRHPGSQLALEHIHLGEVVARMTERGREAPPDLRALEHPRHLFTHGRFEVDLIPLKLRGDIRLARKLVVGDCA